METKVVPIEKFKSQCLKIIDDTVAKNYCVVITKHGKPVAKLIPIKKKLEGKR